VSVNFIVVFGVGKLELTGSENIRWCLSFLRKVKHYQQAYTSVSHHRIGLYRTSIVHRQRSCMIDKQRCRVRLWVYFTSATWWRNVNGVVITRLHRQTRSTRSSGRLPSLEHVLSRSVHWTLTRRLTYIAWPTSFVPSVRLSIFFL